MGPGVGNAGKREIEELDKVLNEKIETRGLPCRWGSGALHCKPGVGKRELNLYEGIVNEELEQRDLPCRWGSGRLHCKPGVGNAGKREIEKLDKLKPADCHADG